MMLQLPITGVNVNSNYNNIEDIPAHIFSNKECTKSPSPALREYLEWMVTNHPNDLKYIWAYTQQFKNYGGCYVLTYGEWTDKLKRDLAKQKEKE